MNIIHNSQTSNGQIASPNCLEGIENVLAKTQITLDAIAEAIVWIDSSHSIEWHNSAFTKLLNIPKRKLVKQKLIEILPLSLAGKTVAEEEYPDVKIRNGNYQVTEYELVQGKNSLALEISGNCLQDGQENQTVILVIKNVTQTKELQANTEFLLADITQRKQEEEILKQKEAQYRDLVETANSIILRWDIDGYIHFINDYGERFFGFDRSELIGRHLIGTIVPDLDISGRDLQIFISNLCQFPENYALSENENIRKTQESVWVCWANKPIYDEYGNLVEILSVGTDATERKQIEYSLRHSELKFRHLFENSLVGIYRTRYEDGLIVDANQKFVELLGYNCAAEVIRKIYITDICASPDVRQQIMDQLHQEGEVSNFEVKFRKQDSSVRYGLYSARLNLEENYIEAVMIDITERKQAQANLSRSNALLQAQLEAVPDGILVIDENQEVVSYNQRFRELWYIPEELISSRADVQLIDYVLPQLAQPEEFIAKVDYLYHNPQLISRDEILFKDGRIFDRYSSPVSSSLGDYYGRIWYFQDITDRKRREESLSLIVQGTASQIGSEFFRSCTRYLAEVLQVRYALISEFTNDKKDKARTLAFWQGDDFGDNFEYELAETPFAQVLEGERVRYVHSLQILFPDNPYLQELNAESYIGLCITNPTGKILGILAVLDTKPLEDNSLAIQDLILKIFAARVGAELERQYAEKALEKQLQRVLLLEQITQDIRESLDLQTILQTTVNQIGNIFQVDRCQIFDYQAEPVAKSRIVAEYLISDYAPMLGIEVTLQDAACLEQGFAQEQPIAYTDVYQELILQRTTPIYEQFQVKSLMAVRTSYRGKPNGAIVVHQCSDFREWTSEEIEILSAVAAQVGIAIAQAQLLEQEKQQRQALEEAKKNAEVANKAKSEFLANMSHELRTPLNAILGFAQLMVKDNALTAKQREHLSIINHSGEHLLNLINDVLEMSRIEAGKIELSPQPLDLFKLLSTLANIFRFKAQEKKLSFQFDLASDLPPYINTDEGKLRQVLMNLIDNAVKFTDRGGIKVEVTKSYRSGLQSRSLRGRLFLNFVIEDTGIGIASENQTQLFQPFMQTGTVLHNQGGTGLGLCISSHFLKLMEGDIQFTSTLGEGSTFRFSIPVTLAQATEIETTSPQQRVSRLAPQQPNYRLLVVDDCLENRELLLQLLTQVGFKVQTATNGEEAIASWEQWQPHLIWMDMRMPIMDGYEATRRIKASATESKPIIIALTASAFAEQRANILEAGCDDFVSKPCPQEVIFNKLAEHLGVTYLYEEDSLTNPISQLSCLSYPDLQVMTSEWIEALHQAAIQVDADLVKLLIAQIPLNYPNLAQKLTELTNQYNFDEIIELTQ